MSKKLASGSDAFVLDVKYGNGAFMETAEAAEALGRLMVEIGTANGKNTAALITNMDRPIGRGVGNAIEVMEAIDTLKGAGPADITELSLRLAAHMIFAGGAAASPDEGQKSAEEALSSGAGLDKLRELIAGQGGNPAVIDDFSLFPAAKLSVPVRADADGYVTSVAARDIGIASRRSGAGRETKDDAIDPAAGVVLHKTVGDAAKAGETLAVVYGNDAKRLSEAAAVAKAAFRIGPEIVAPAPLIHAVIAKRIAIGPVGDSQNT
jgi:pyrimidine-nucleoside phosphorylase